MKTYQIKVKQASLLGQLLTAAGIVSVEVVSEAFQSAKITGADMGRMLVYAGYLGECDLRAAQEAMKEVELRTLAHDQAAYALKYAYDNCLPFQDALEQTVLRPITTPNPNMLGELLLGARIISEYQLAIAMGQSKDCGLTLGRIFVLTHIITVPLLETSVELLRMIRDCELTPAQATDVLRLVVRKKLDVHEAAQRVAPGPVFDDSRPKLGALLSGAQLVADFDALNAAEVGLETGKPIGQIFHEYGLVSSLVLKAALRLQALVAQRSLTLSQAHELLQQVHKLQVPVDDLLRELAEMKQKVISLLVQSKLVREYDITRAVTMAPAFKDDPLQALVETSVVKLAIIRDAARCTSLIDQGKLRPELAAQALQQCKRDGATLEEVLKKLEVETATRLAVVQAPVLVAGLA